MHTVPMRTPAAISPTLIPSGMFAPAELSAMRLDGHLVMRGATWCVPGMPTRTEERAAHLAAELGPRWIAERESVLWLLGVLDTLPTPIPVCVDIRHRPGESFDRRLAVREVVIDADQIEAIGPLRFTSAARTILDLLRQDAPVAQVTLREFVRRTGVTVEEVREQVERRVHLPHKRRALSRLEQVYAGITAPTVPPAQPAVTR